MTDKLGETLAYLKNMAADLVLFNADVITMNPAQPRAQAVAIKDGRIIGVGSNEEISSYCSESTEKTDLCGKTVLPGFIETHNHMGAYAAIIHWIDASSTKIQNIASILDKVKEKAQGLPMGEWIIGFGYDNTGLMENRHLNRWDLDQATTDHPVCIFHVSGHLAALNSKAMELTGITKDTPQPAGGKIYKDGETGEPIGVLGEGGALAYLFKVMPKVTLEDRLAGFSKCNQTYVEAGVTSIHDAGVGLNFGMEELIAYSEAVSTKKISVRVNAMIAISLLEAMKKEGSFISTGCGDDQFRIGAAKILNGGSIQGGTAALFDPYLNDPSSTGFTIYSQEKLNEMVLNYHKAGYQVAIHANGDLEVEAAIKAIETALYVWPRDDHRHRIEHCQMATEGQLERMGKLGITASFFPVHIYYWGDRHRDVLIGPKRAARINPLQSACANKIRFSLHSDCPVTPISPIMCLYSAVARETSGGHILGAEQAISVTEALRALTIDAAYMAFEENSKGSVEKGKLADLVVLSGNPYEIEPKDLKDLDVETTIIGGVVVYAKNQ